MGLNVGGYVGYVRPITGTVVAAFGLNWFAFVRPVWDGCMEECNDR